VLRSAAVIERAVIHVGGPAGSGKTTFIEAMLTGSDVLVIAARCVRDDTLRQFLETAPRSHPELRRYHEAGAIAAAL
jgi:Ni2+-binding GTPase involved in maturation of urease and hydrogenase